MNWVKKSESNRIGKKFYPLPILAKKISQERKNNRTIALANGGFDLIHVGHVRYLKAAKKTADILVVALNSDRSLRALKGKNRPLIPEKGRIQILSSFSCVDYVTLFDEPRVDRVLLALKPDFHCKGSDYTEATVPERETVLSYGGKIAIVGGDKVESTSAVIRRIKERYPAYSRIAIIRVSSLGDIIHTLPAFQLLRNNFPRAHISWFVEPAGARLLKNFLGIDEIIEIDLKKKGIRNKIREIRRIRQNYKEKFDLVIDFQGLLKSAMLCRMLKCPSIGFHPQNLKEPLAKCFYTRTSDFFRENQHVIFKNIRVLGMLGIRDLEIQYPRRENRQNNRLRQFMKNHHLRPKKFVILNIGGGWQSKILNPDQNQIVAELLGKKRKTVLLWGNEREKQVVSRIAASTPGIMGIFLDFHELFDLVEKSRMVITADTLVMHVADMVGVPTVGIFGPTAPKRNGSLLKDSVALFQKKPCSFCYKKKCVTMECLKNLDLNKILDAVKAIDDKSH